MSSTPVIMKFVKPSMIPQAADIKAAVGWGVAAGAGAIYLVQPFDYIRKTFFEKPTEEQN